MSEKSLKELLILLLDEQLDEGVKLLPDDDGKDWTRWSCAPQIRRRNRLTWSPAELEHVKMYYGERSLIQLSMDLFRTPDAVEKAIYNLKKDGNL